MEKSKMNRIAVLMSSYNGEAYIRTQLDSILNQKLSDSMVYLIVRDDGSSDRTVDILKGYDNIKLIEGKNKGYIASFIDLIQYARTGDYDYYSFADQDDRWDLDKLQCAIDLLEKEDNRKPLLYQSRSRTADSELNYIGIPDPPQRPITLYNTIIQTVSAGHTYVFNRALVDKIGFDIHSDRLFGHDSFVTNVAAIFGKIVFDSNAHTDYRQHGTNQLGTSNVGMMNWIRYRINRIKKGQGKLYARQIEYIYETYKNEMHEEYESEIRRFLTNRANLYHRVYYITTTKLYRQRKIEDHLFRLLYLVGGYNTVNN